MSLDMDLNPERVHVLRAAQEHFTGPVRGFPTVAEADPDDDVLHIVLEQLAPWLPQLAATLDSAGGTDATRYVESLARDDPAGYDLLRLVSLARYLSCRPVWDALGYTGRVPAPIDEGEADRWLDGLLEQPRRRGKIYRSVTEPR